MHEEGSVGPPVAGRVLGVPVHSSSQINSGSFTHVQGPKS